MAIGFSARSDLPISKSPPARRPPVIVWIAGVAVLALGLSAIWFATQFDLFGRAQISYDRHQYRSALLAARNHLNYFPGDVNAQLMAARCLSRLGRAGEADEFYRRAAGRLQVDDMHDRATGLLQANHPRQAAEVYEEILKSRPRDALALKRLAAVRMAYEQWRDVLKLADRLIAMPAEEVAGQTMAAIAHHERKHYEQAVAACLRVLDLDPELKRMPLPRTLFWNNLSLDLIAGGRTDEARKYLRHALADCQDAGLMELLGLCYSQQGAIDEAERCWLQAESWDPNNADVCLDLGELAMSRRRWSEAVGFLKRAAEQSAEAVGPVYNLSQAYRMLGKAEEAERYRRLADERRRARPAGAAGMGAVDDLESSRDIGRARARELPR